MKQRFEMTQKQLDELLEACKPVPLIAINAGMPRSPQQRANGAWRQLGNEMGFKWETVRPIPGEPQTVFMAEPSASGPTTGDSHE